jgi:hypothetical protein
MKLFIMHVPPALFYFVCRMFEYFAQLSILRHPQFAFFPHRKGQNVPAIQDNV